jgi:hypothetical protein
MSTDHTSVPIAGVVRLLVNNIIFSDLTFSIKIKLCNQPLQAL